MRASLFKWELLLIVGAILALPAVSAAQMVKSQQDETMGTESHIGSLIGHASAAKMDYRPATRPGRTRLLAVCWTGFLMLFFTFSTTQEYYSMPCYPALALLIGAAIAEGGS